MLLLIFTKIYINYDKKRHKIHFYDKVTFIKEGKTMQKITRTIKRAVADMAKKSARMEANTACPCMNFQMKEPQAVKKLRKF